MNFWGWFKIRIIIVRRFRRLAQIKTFNLRQSAKSADHFLLVYPDTLRPIIFYEPCPFLRLHGNKGGYPMDRGE